MVIDIKMCRFDNVPWGFRLVGGADFECPLTVVKVTEGSIAEEAGLKVDDVIVRINDTPASPLTHDESNKLIKHCGNVFYFGVYREEPEPIPMHFPVIGNERPDSPLPFLEGADSRTPSPLTVEEYRVDDVADLEERPESVISENTEIKLVEEEIAAVLSGETEVLKEHNVLGIFPKPGVCMTSDVLRTLNEEAVMTKAEKDKENKKWSTFLQKPDRPVPLSKAQIEAERRAANAYKVKIVKSAPRTPERAVSPSVVPVVKEPTPPPVVEEPEQVPEPEPEVDEAPPTDTEVPNLEEQIVEEENNKQVEQSNDNDEKADKEKEATPENKEIEDAEQEQVTAAADEDKKENAENAENATVPNKTEEELALERQLADVQRQLAALSSLPSTIQDTLDAVTKQLADILPAFKLQQTKESKTSKLNVENETRAISLERIEEAQTEPTKEDVKAEENVKENNEIEIETIDDNKTKTDNTADSNEKKETEGISTNMESTQNEDKENLKKQKRHDVIDELEEHLERKQQNVVAQRRSKRAFGPLTPSSERPVVLPGGRRWYRPKDAYNDEFIAETLSAQAELITGTTLGVNFMKYQKPEKKIDLNRSEVYKVIHHLDREPVCGIEVRPPVVPAEADVKKAARI